MIRPCLFVHDCCFSFVGDFLLPFGLVYRCAEFRVSGRYFLSASVSTANISVIVDVFSLSGNS